MKRFNLLILFVLFTSCVSTNTNHSSVIFKLGTEINDKLGITKYYYQIINGVSEENTFSYSLIENVNFSNNKLVNSLSILPMPTTMKNMGLFDLNIYHKTNRNKGKANNYYALLSLVESSYSYDFTNNEFILTDWERDTTQKIKAINEFFSWKNINLPPIDIDLSNEYKTSNIYSTKNIFQLQYELLNNQQVFENTQYTKTILFYYFPNNSFIPIKCKIKMKKLNINDQYYFSIENDNSGTIEVNSVKYKPFINMELHTTNNLKLYKLTSDIKLSSINTSDLFFREKIEILNEYR